MPVKGPTTIHRREPGDDYRSLPRRRWTEAEVREALRDFHTKWGRPPTTVELVRPMPGAAIVKAALGVATLAEAWTAMGWGDQVLIRAPLRGERCAAAIRRPEGLRQCPTGTANTGERYCARHLEFRPDGDFTPPPPAPEPDPWDDLIPEEPGPDAPWLALNGAFAAQGPQEPADPPVGTNPSPPRGAAAPSDAEGPISAIPAQPVPEASGGIAATHYFPGPGIVQATVLRIPGGTKPGWWEVMPGPGVRNWPARRILVGEDGRHDPVSFPPGNYHFRYAGDVEGAAAQTLGQLLAAATASGEIARLARGYERMALEMRDLRETVDALVDFLTRPD